ncbi:MAG: RidA family protein [Acidobacteriia bacterium]|nr:RidA family protein [Terriglobia bacterium]
MKRRSIEIEGFKHDNPIPAASRIGPFVASGGISGKDPETGKIPGGIEEQCALAFAHMRRIVETAGGTTEDILKVTVWLKDGAHRKIVNQEWLRMFPDAESRPARHTFVGLELAGNTLVQCEFLAVLNGGK